MSVERAPADAPSAVERTVPTGRRVMALARVAVAPAMLGLLGLYVALHSPLRDAIASALGFHQVNPYPLPQDRPTAGGTADAASGFVLIASAIAASWLAASSASVRRYERPLVLVLCTLAFISVPAALVAGLGSWTHSAPLRPPKGPLLAAVIPVVFVLVAFRRGARFRAAQVPRVRWSPLVIVLVTLAGGLLVASAAVALEHPPTGGDALTYHVPLAKFLWQDGNLTSFLDRAPSLWSLAHPGTAELWYGALGILGGDALADLGQLPFALLGAAAVAAFARRLGVGQGAAVVAGAAFLLAPMVVMQSVTQANDVVGSAVLMATVALVAAPAAEWNRSRFVLTGLGLGLTAATKLALLPGVAGVILFCVVTFIRRRPRITPRLAVLALGAFAIVVAPWWIRNLARHGNPIYPQALPIIGRGVYVSTLGRVDTSFVPRRIAWPLYPLLEAHDDRSGLGALLAVGAAPGFVVALLRARPGPLALWGCVAAVTLPAWWLWTLHEPRFFLSLLGLAFAFVPFALLAVPNRRRTLAVATLIAAAGFSAVVTLEQAIAPLARTPSERAAFYNQVWGVDPLVEALPERVSLVLSTGYGPPNTDYAAYAPLLGRHHTRLVLPIDRGEVASTDELIRRMRAAHVRYVYAAVEPEWRKAVRSLYEPARFDLVHSSLIEVGAELGARRHLYRPASPAARKKAIVRYLFRLRQP